MKTRVNFHLLSRWGPIVTAKLRKKIGSPRAPSIPRGRRSFSSAELGLGLGAFRRETIADFGPSPGRTERFFRRQFRVLGTEWNDLPPSAGARARSAEDNPIDWRPNFGGAKGEDVKLPWELSRFHGLAEMAYFSTGASPAERDRTAKEIFAQLTGFAADNPAGEGAHWGCAMDVSLRALNVILAHELLHAAGWRAPEAQRHFLADFVDQHARFVIRNLEWYRVGRGNHYLANLVGLLACSLWLPDSPSAKRWFKFAAEELYLEADRQFLSDGSNFEGSVFYHRLSLELLAVGYALLRGPGRKKRGWGGDLPWLAARVHAGLGFLRDLSDCRGHGVQFGDNDSGRVFQLQVPEIRINGQTLTDALDIRDTLSLARLFSGEGEEAVLGPLGEVALWLAGEQVASTKAARAGRSPVKKQLPERGPPASAVCHEFSLPPLDPSHVDFGHYGQFGVYFWKSRGAELWLRCGLPSKDGHGGHAHFDQLHLEVRLEGVPVTFDPGSLTYTGDADQRNFFRGPGAHFLPRLPEVEARADQSVDLFRYPGLPEGECLEASGSGFRGRYCLGSQVAYRKLALEKGRVLVWDWAEGGSLLSALPHLPFVSWGYGQKVGWPIAELGRKGSP